MLGPSRRLFSAIEAVLFVACEAGGAPVHSGQIARRQGIPRRYLELVLQRLVRDGILEGVRGPRGGYRLARDRRRISIGDIIRAVRAVDGTPDPCAGSHGSELARKVVRPFWTELRDATMQRLNRVSIDDLCRRARRAGVASDTGTEIDLAATTDAGRPAARPSTAQIEGP
ncbi:MAG: RrF2 family transcriptional regulator [Kiloniellales bacterium]